MLVAKLFERPSYIYIYICVCVCLFPVQYINIYICTLCLKKLVTNLKACIFYVERANCTKFSAFVQVYLENRPAKFHWNRLTFDRVTALRVGPLKMRGAQYVYIEEWSRFDQRIVDYAVNQWRVCLQACVTNAGGHFEHLIK